MKFVVFSLNNKMSPCQTPLFKKGRLRQKSKISHDCAGLRHQKYTILSFMMLKNFKMQKLKLSNFKNANLLLQKFSTFSTCLFKMAKFESRFFEKYEFLNYQSFRQPKRFCARSGVRKSWTKSFHLKFLRAHGVHAHTCASKRRYTSGTYST